MPIVILAKVELPDSPDPLAYPPDYVEKLLDPKNWNDFEKQYDDLVPADELRTAFVEVYKIEDMEIVSVKKV